MAVDDSSCADKVDPEVVGYFVSLVFFLTIIGRNKTEGEREKQRERERERVIVAHWK